MYRLTFLCLLSVLLTACIPPTEGDNDAPLAIDATDPLVRRVFELQNERREDSLLVYLGRDARSRFLAARALASFPTLSPTAFDSLVARLADSEPAVQRQAAYALGQTEDPRATAPLTAAFDATGTHVNLNAAILEAVGKTGDATTAALLAGITTYTAADTVLASARVRALLYAALNGHHDSTADAAIVDLLLDPAYGTRARHPAALYLQRIAVTVDTARERRLRDQLRNTIDPVTAMGIIRALGRSGRPASSVALLRRLETAQDWRERVEVINALAGFEYASVRESIVEVLKDPHPLVGRAAGDFLVQHGVESDAALYLQLARDLPDPALKPYLYRAANRYLSPFLSDYRRRITNDLQQHYTNTADAYIRADQLRALGEFAWNFRILHGYYLSATLPVERTAVAEALQAISDRPDFDTFFRSSTRRVRAELAVYFRQMIEGREEGPAYHAALALAGQAEAYRTAYPDLDWLDATLEEFRLPQQVEAYREVYAARNALSGSSRPLPTMDDAKARPIDWARLDAAAGKVITVTTSLGDITVALYPDVAPATVTSFLELVEQGYYNGKVFHRVVPNFVAQGGGPRGDGFGSEDFSVRSETPLRYWDRAGLLGMASAGKDTEGVQFFITHRPTPHLDGKYTIFGEVTAGQPVVDRLVPGSRIDKIVLR